MDNRVKKVLGLVEQIEDAVPANSKPERAEKQPIDFIEESMVARVQSGRKMVSAEAALRHAREIAHKRQPGSKPTLSDIAAAHRRLSSSVKHESEEIDELSIDMLSRYKKAASVESRAADAAGDIKKADKRFSGIVKATKKQFAKFEKKPVAEEVETIDESFAVKNSSGETVDVKFSESEATKRAEELTQKTGQKHSVRYERTAMVRTVKEDTDGKDTVTLEIPALIRALEWAREDAEDDVEIHKFVEKLINHEGTVDMEFFSEEVIPSADRKVDKNGRPYPAHRVQVGTNESAPNRSINDDDWYIYDPNSGKQIKQFSPAPAKMRFAGDRDSHVPNHIKPELEKARKEHGSQLRADKGMTAKYSIKESTGNFHKRLPQEAVGKSNKKIAEMLKADLERIE